MLRCVEFPDATMVDHEMKMSMETEDTTAVPPSSSEHAFYTSGDKADELFLNVVMESATHCKLVS